MCTKSTFEVIVQILTHTANKAAFLQTRNQDIGYNFVINQSNDTYILRLGLILRQG